MTQRRIGIMLSYLNLIAKNLVVFIYTPILLRFLGQSEYGLYQMANSIINSLLLLNLGLGSAYIRFYSRGKDNKKYVSNLNGMYAILFMIISALSMIIGLFLSSNVGFIFKASLTSEELETMKFLMVVLVINIAVSFPSSLFDSYIMAHEQFKFQRSRQLFQTIITPILTIPLLFLGLKSISIVIIQTIVTFLFLFLNINFSIKKLNMEFSFSKLDKNLIREILSFSFFIFLNQIIDQINWNLPNFLLGILEGAKQVAIFAVAIQIKNIFITLSTTLSGVFVPEINKIVSTNDDNNKLTSIMTRVGRIQMIVLLYVLGGFLVLGKYFIEVWAGAEYSVAYNISLFLIVPFVITLIQNTGYEIIRAKNLHRFRAIIEFIFALVNILLTFIFIKIFGLVGSAIGTAITTVIVSGLIMNWYYHFRVGLDMKYFWKIISSTIPMFLIPTISISIAISLLPVRNFYTFLVYGILYTILYMICYYKIVSNEEERSMMNMLIYKIVRRKKNE